MSIKGVLETQFKANAYHPWNEQPLADSGIHRPVLTDAPPWPMISVIVPAHNEEAYLGQTLEWLARQRYPSHEVIVVANGCTDRTAQVARGKCDRLIVDPEKGLSRARNLGAQVAEGDLLVFLDADTLLPPDTLRLIAQRFTRKHAAGTVRGKPDLDRPVYQLIYFMKNFMHRFWLHEGSSGVILCWRDDFEGIGGFDPDLHVMENSHLIRRLRRYGRYCFVGKATATTSMRRYELGGSWRICGLWFRLWVRSLISNVRNRAYETIR